MTTHKKDWTMEQKGWWVNIRKNIGVCIESDGKWYSYISSQERIMQTPCFKTMKEAIKNAETRFAKKQNKGARHE